MSINPHSWTPGEDQRLLELRAMNLSWAFISLEIPGRTVAACKTRWSMLHMTPEQYRAMRVRENAARRARSFTIPKKRSSHPGWKPSREALDYRDARLAVEPRDLTAFVLGDPLPGYSALEIKLEQAK